MLEPSPKSLHPSPNLIISPLSYPLVEVSAVFLLERGNRTKFSTTGVFLVVFTLAGFLIYHLSPTEEWTFCSLLYSDVWGKAWLTAKYSISFYWMTTGSWGPGTLGATVAAAFTACSAQDSNPGH